MGYSYRYRDKWERVQRTAAANFCVHVRLPQLLIIISRNKMDFEDIPAAEEEVQETVQETYEEPSAETVEEPMEEPVQEPAVEEPAYTMPEPVAEQDDALV